MASEPGRKRSLQSLLRLSTEVDGWLDLGDAERALELLRPLLDHPMTRQEGRALRCRALVELERYTAALAALDEIALEPHDVEWLAVTRGWCHKRLGDLPAAIARMEQLIAVAAGSAIGHYNLGCYLALAGDVDRSLGELATAFELDGGFRAHARNESDLDALRDDPRFAALCDAAD